MTTESHHHSHAAVNTVNHFPETMNPPLGGSSETLTPQRVAHGPSTGVSDWVHHEDEHPEYIHRSPDQVCLVKPTDPAYTRSRNARLPWEARPMTDL